MDPFDNKDNGARGIDAAVAQRLRTELERAHALLVLSMDCRLVFYSHKRGDPASVKNAVEEVRKRGATSAAADAVDELQASEHLSASEVAEGLLSGSLRRGVLRVLAKKPDMAFVKVEGFPLDVVVLGEMQNRCLHGDEVALQLLPKALWEAVPFKGVPPPELKAECDHILQPRAKAVAILDSARRADVCVVWRRRKETAVPVDTRLPQCTIRRADGVSPPTSPKRGGGGEDGVPMLHVGVWQDWPLGAAGPYISDVVTLGKLSRAVEEKRLIMVNGIHDEPFSEDALSCLPTGEWSVEPYLDGRRDFRCGC